MFNYSVSSSLTMLDTLCRTSFSELEKTSLNNQFGCELNISCINLVNCALFGTLQFFLKKQTHSLVRYAHPKLVGILFLDRGQYQTKTMPLK